MDKSIATIDWTHWQAFAAVAEEGSLSAGARKLGLSQPTLGRHVRALEEALGVTLFRRQSRGLSLSEAGLELLPSAKAMQEAAGRLALTAAGRATDVSGTVRILIVNGGRFLEIAVASLDVPGSHQIGELLFEQLTGRGSAPVVASGRIPGIGSDWIYRTQCNEQSRETSNRPEVAYVTPRLLHHACPSSVKRPSSTEGIVRDGVNITVISVVRHHSLCGCGTQLK